VPDYLETTLRTVVDILGFPATISRSSRFNLDPALRGQARVVAAAALAQATHYVNAPGGRALYDAAVFARHGMALSFLSPYDGRFVHLLPALMTTDAEEIRSDVLATSWLTDDRE